MTPDSPSRGDDGIDEEGDWIVRQFIAPVDLRRLPEEYVARHSHLLGAFSFPRYRFRDPELGAWIRRVGELLGSEEEIERCRDHYLTTEERAIARKHAAEDF